jgi:Leucine Rich repeat
MESIEISGGNAMTGGWDASRLQYARYRTLVAGESLPIDELRMGGQSAVQQRSDLAGWYSHAIAWTHALMHADGGKHRETLFRWIAQVYQMNLRDAGSKLPINTTETLSIERFLRIDDSFAVEHPTFRKLTELCLAGCDLSEEGLQSLPTKQPLQWLDLTRLPVDSDQVMALVGDPEQLQRLALEGTNVDTSIGQLIGRANALTELDLTSTSVDSSTFEKIPPSLEVLYLTNTKVDDSIIDRLASLPHLQILDIQLSGISEAGIQRLKALRPELELNTLKIRRQ